MIGLFITASAMTEGAASDWLASGLVQGFGTSETVGIIGLGAFLCAMTLVRAGGARLIAAWGRVVTVRLSAAVAIVGMLLYCLVPSLPLAVLGGVLWGLGSGLGFPVGVSAASDDPLRAAQRTSVVVTIAYTGFFIGPPLIGFLANHLGFRHALLVLLGPLLFALAISKVVAPRPNRET
jgi:MFS family permease